jgi:hypothetical protein
MKALSASPFFEGLDGLLSELHFMGFGTIFSRGWLGEIQVCLDVAVALFV